MQNTDVAIASMGPKTPIRKIDNKSPRKHVAIENKDSKSISYARNLGSTYGWENAHPPNMGIINVLKHGVVGSTKNMYRGKTIIEDCKGANSKKINNMVKNENKLVATTIQNSIDPIGFVENEVFATPDVLDVATERSKEEGDQKTVDLKHKSDVIEGDQETANLKHESDAIEGDQKTVDLKHESDVIEGAKAKEHEERLLLKAKRKERKKQKKTVDLKHESDVIEGAKAKEHEERLLLKAKRKERKKQKKTDKKRAQTMNLAKDLNLVDSNSEAINEIGYEGEELVVEQTTMKIPSSSALERIIQQLFSFEITLVVSCSVALIGVVLSIFIYIAVNFLETS